MSLQALQLQTISKTTGSLVEAVEQLFRALEIERLDKVFITLQHVMECCQRCGGGNDYKLTYMGKQHLRAEGKLLAFILCDSQVYQHACHLADLQN